jgi:trk system potassium uptake protein TrkA
VRIVIVGAGEVGFAVASQLSQEGHDVTVVEADEAKAAKVENELDVMVVRGNGARPHVLERAGICVPCATDLLIACTNHDEVNILACWIAKRAGTPKVMGRARSLEFTDNENWSRELGIDMLISPERSVAREIEELLAVSSAVRTVEIAGGKAGVYAFRIAERSPLVATPLKELRKSFPTLVSVVIYVDRGEEGFVPSGEDSLLAGDLCYVVCARDQVWRLEELFGLRKSRPLRRVLIVGGGKIGYQVARRLELRVSGVDIRLIDQDREKCDRLAGELERTIVLCGEGTDKELLQYEGVAEADGFVTTTASDEANILIGILGKSLGAAKSVAVVRRKSFLQMERHVEVDAMVNPNQALASIIMRHVRFPRASGQLSLLESIGAEMLETTIPASSSAVGEEVQKLGLPKGIILALVERGREAFVPSGDTVLREGDRIILFASNELMPRALEVLGVE